MKYVILEKSKVKSHVRTRKGHLERVKEFERKTSEKKEIDSTDYEKGQLVLRDLGKFGQKGRWQVLEITSDKIEMTEQDNGKKSPSVKARQIYDSKFGDTSMEEDPWHTDNMKPSASYIYGVNTEVVPYNPKTHPMKK